MPEVRYDWQRFWRSPEGTYTLSDGGFLADPETDWGSALNPDARKFNEIAATPCLVLLGEPGIGKSHELAAAKETVEAAAGESGDQVLPVDLRAFQTDHRLCARLFESGQFRHWIAGPHRLQLFLDSLDEGLIRISTVAALLEEELARCPVHRLMLRIACRTADWPQSLEAALKRLWGDANVGVYELLPLRRRDVRAAAEAEGIDCERFIETVQDRDAVPLAIKPVTLRLLVRLFRRDAALPHRQVQLYEQGCRLLCEEPNPARREAGLEGEVSAPVRFAVACRIAAATVFGKRFAIWTDIDEGQVPPEDVTVRQLAGGTENVNGGRAEVTEDAIREAYHTGLFTSRGPHRMGWAHQTYAEFLAATYLVRNGMTLEQILSLVVHPNDPGQKLVPQLYETTAWVAGMQPDVFAAVMERDPEVLLRSDVASADVEQRQRLVETLLSLYNEEKIVDRDLDLRGRYSALAHPGLADQLRPYVCDRETGYIARRVAIDIAEACKVQELLPDLLRIALDQTDDKEVRKNAAHAVLRAGDSEAKAELKPLALGQAGADPDDDLKGCGLMAVWPEHMTPQELFQTLTPRQRSTYGGSYSFFLYNLRESLATTLSPDQLPFALQWIAEGRCSGHYLEDIGERIMTRAWEALEEHPELAQPFANAALARLRKDDLIAKGTEGHPLAEMIREEHPRRRRVLAAAVSLQGVNDNDLFQLAYTETPLAVSDDAPWLAGRLRDAPPEKRRRWGQLIELVFDRGKVEHLELVLKICRDFPDLADLFPYMAPVGINSPEGRKAKARFLRHKRLMKRLDERRNRPLLTPPPKERVLALLDKFDVGDKDAWWQLNREMTLEPDTRYYGDELEWDLTALPGWRDADEPTRVRLILAAKRYVSSPPPIDQSWLGTNTLHRPACAGYRALALLRTTHPAFLESLSAVAWATWAPIAIAFPLSTSSLCGETPHTDVVRLAYQHAPDAVLAAFKVFYWESDRLDHCWDDRIAAVLLDKVQTRRLDADRLAILLGQLLRHNYEGAVRYARLLSCFPPPSAPWARARAKVAALALLRHMPKLGLVSVSPSVRADSAFGREVFEELARHGLGTDDTEFAEPLSEQDVADVYLWLARQYPHAEDPRHEGAYFAGPRDSIVWFRDGLLQRLKSRGTLDACEQVRRIAGELPDVPWLKWAVLEAEGHTRRQTWEPASPEQVIALGQDRQRRYVQNGQQLLKVLYEALQRLQELLHGETAAQDLWDNRGNTRHPIWCPVDEGRLSDWVARNLRVYVADRGIVVNREVHIRRGQATDIHVDALVPGEGNQTPSAVSAIIEVKGCYHRELETAMETQLVHRYLKDNQCPHGLYLVGWFNCGPWSQTDYRKAAAPRYSIEAALERFARQAQALQATGKIQGLALTAVVLDTALA
ncbi:MAG TPA: hypothetical protein VM238_16495 [Phycisphaerae bacterium]|nr:hypothetical protein [Phycisphaerae bacterium]